MGKRGQYIRTPEHRKQMAETQRRVQLKRYRLHPMSEEQKRNISLALKGRPFSEEHRKHLSEAMKGKSSPMKGRTNWFTYTMSESSRQSIAEKRRKYFKEHPEARQAIAQISKTRRRYTWTEARRAQARQALLSRMSEMMQAQKKSPSKPERKLSYLLRHICPREFKYNGDCRLGVVIAGQVPDFWNTNGQKKVIDLLGCYWHGCPLCFEGNGDAYVKQRVARYYSCGIMPLIIWEHELRDKETLSARIKSFVDGKEV